MVSTAGRTAPCTAQREPAGQAPGRDPQRSAPESGERDVGRYRWRYPPGTTCDPMTATHQQLTNHLDWLRHHHWTLDGHDLDTITDAIHRGDQPIFERLLHTARAGGQAEAAVLISALQPRLHHLHNRRQRGPIDPNFDTLYTHTWLAIAELDPDRPPTVEQLINRIKRRAERAWRTNPLDQTTDPGDLDDGHHHTNRHHDPDPTATQACGRVTLDHVTATARQAVDTGRIDPEAWATLIAVRVNGDPYSTRLRGNASTARSDVARAANTLRVLARINCAA